MVTNKATPQMAAISSAEVAKNVLGERSLRSNTITLLYLTMRLESPNSSVHINLMFTRLIPTTSSDP